ncbi:MAG: dTDP-4-dehydrorhamnose reductase [Smithellaceae bacterium]|nr:dTDP-4-dehydrorhamnose reductase [Syntrophaceae bacterium]MBP8609692.1 dTDP-4-dehydrorhamnose reductase [Syntrophaceae bacterium]MDX9815514.1 dTDP-4-dehydrorhamnose reductase [Smithellaceae bacterium]NMD04793.1 dTDP-4-dehydrorhamnose reductase [Deltaproteobacteria bacterium]HQM43661.1 dTDP-4-dehydrorhamnose reductase [Smithellaceae bacterium]
MKILLLGHKGMLGSDLLKTLFARYEVVGMDKEEIDIVSAKDCKNAVAEVEPDIVINAAAFTNVDGCETQRDECFAVNAEAVKNICEACRGRDIRIIHFSTDYVFDGKAKSPYREQDICNPINVYGESKLAGERYLQSLSEDYLLIRTSWLYGINGKNFVRTILDKAKTTTRLSVVDDQIGCPTYTKDLAAAVELLIFQNQRGIFHVTNRGHCSWYEFAVRILKEVSKDEVEVKPIKTHELPLPAMRPAYSALSMQKFITTTGKTPQPWQLAVQDYLKNIKCIQ